MVPHRDSPDVRLVRNFVPALVRQKGADARFDVATPSERRRLAIEKLIEEADELRYADGVEVLDRLAGVYELALMIAKELDMDTAALDRWVQMLDQVKGGFSQGFVVRGGA